MPRYAELHCHTEFSFLDGASSVDDLVGRAAQLGMGALAVTDHQGLYGAVRFVTAARTADLHAVVGVEIELLDAAAADPQGIVVPAQTSWKGAAAGRDSVGVVGGRCLGDRATGDRARGGSRWLARTDRIGTPSPSPGRAPPSPRTPRSGAQGPARCGRRPARPASRAARPRPGRIPQPLAAGQRGESRRLQGSAAVHTRAARAPRGGDRGALRVPARRDRTQATGGRSGGRGAGRGALRAAVRRGPGRPERSSRPVRSPGTPCLRWHRRIRP